MHCFLVLSFVCWLFFVLHYIMIDLFQLATLLCCISEQNHHEDTGEQNVLRQKQQITSPPGSSELWMGILCISSIPSSQARHAATAQTRLLYLPPWCSLPNHLPNKRARMNAKIDWKAMTEGEGTAHWHDNRSYTCLHRVVQRCNPIHPSYFVSRILPSIGQHVMPFLSDCCHV